MIRSILLAAAMTIGFANAAQACEHCGQSGHGMLVCQACGCDCCPCQICERTIMVPMCVTETHMKVKIVETMKEREETYTVFQQVPKKRTYSTECCYLETEVKSKLITCEQCRRVMNPLTLEDKVRVPVSTELREGVHRHEICTLCGKVCVEEPCSCCVAQTADMPRVQNCTRQDVVFEETKKTIDYCVQTPKFAKKECGVETLCELVPVTKTRKVQVCVPEVVKVPVEVTVTRMVAKQVLCCEDCWHAMQAQKHKKHEEGWIFKKDK